MRKAAGAVLEPPQDRRAHLSAPGACVLVVYRNREGHAVELWPVEAHRVRPILAPDGSLHAWRCRPEFGPEYDMPPDGIIDPGSLRPGQMIDLRAPWE